MLGAVAYKVLSAGLSLDLGRGWICRGLYEKGVVVDVWPMTQGSRLSWVQALRLFVTDVPFALQRKTCEDQLSRVISAELGCGTCRPGCIHSHGATRPGRKLPPFSGLELIRG